MALACGLDMAIVNPADAELRGALAAGRALLAAPGGMEAYVALAQGGDAARKARPPAGASLPLDVAIERGLKDEAVRAARELLEREPDAGLQLVQRWLVPALDRVGQGFGDGSVFLPQLLSAAGAAQAAFQVIRERMGTAAATGPPVVVATVHGDIHDIGKNIAKALLENYGFAVTDLGRDVPPARVVEAVRRSGARLVGLSALMTTTLPAMEQTVKALRDAGLDCKVWVGGAVLTKEYAARIGADFYARDAMASADYARRFFR
jgi:5-methyltetrahydrofolate--homocysteine methyltransferase